VSAYSLLGDKKTATSVLREFNQKPDFKDYTLSRVVSSEQANPNQNAAVVDGRSKFHEGLLQAGMAER
jgi:ribosomal protein L4